MPEERHGTLANISGNVLERTVKEVFLSKGFELVNFRKWNKEKEKYGKELLLTNVPYQTIYNHPGNTEFLTLSEKYNFAIRIECKWQQSAGSVDEKLPYLYLNCIESMPENEIIIVIDGGGFKKGAIDWLKSSARDKKYTTINKKIKVFSLSEFIAWTNKTLR